MINAAGEGSHQYLIWNACLNLWKGALTKASSFHQNGVDFARAVDTADEDLFDVRSPAGPRDEDHRTTGILPIPPPLAGRTNWGWD